MASGSRPLFGEQQRFMLLLVLPAALLLLLFQVVPIVIGANASFRDWALYRGRKVVLGMRPEHLVLGEGAAGRSFEAVVEVVEQLGSEILLEARLGTTRITVARVPAETPVASGDRVRLSVPPGRLHFFDAETEEAITA